MAYQNFENVDFVYEGCVISDLSFLYGFYREKLFGCSMFREVNDAKASVC